MYSMCKCFFSLLVLNKSWTCATSLRTFHFSSKRLLQFTRHDPQSQIIVLFTVHIWLSCVRSCRVVMWFTLHDRAATGDGHTLYKSLGREESSTSRSGLQTVFHHKKHTGSDGGKAPAKFYSMSPGRQKYLCPQLWTL